MYPQVMAKAAAVDARMLVCINDGNRTGNDAAASSPIPHSPVQWQWQQQRPGGCSCPSTTPAGRAMMPQHHHLSFAHPHNGNSGGSGCTDDCACPQCPPGNDVLASSPVSPFSAIVAVHNEDGNRLDDEDNGAQRQ